MAEFDESMLRDIKSVMEAVEAPTAAPTFSIVEIEEGIDGVVRICAKDPSTGESRVAYCSKDALEQIQAYLVA